MQDPTLQIDVVITRKCLVYTYKHEGRPDSTLYLLMRTSIDNFKPEMDNLVAFNGSPFHGKWDLVGGILTVEFHCWGDMAKAKRHQFVRTDQVGVWTTFHPHDVVPTIKLEQRDQLILNQRGDMWVSVTE